MDFLIGFIILISVIIILLWLRAKYAYDILWYVNWHSIKPESRKIVFSRIIDIKIVFCLLVILGILFDLAIIILPAMVLSAISIIWLLNGASRW